MAKSGNYTAKSFKLLPGNQTQQEDNFEQWQDTAENDENWRDQWNDKKQNLQKKYVNPIEIAVMELSV